MNNAAQSCRLENWGITHYPMPWTAPEACPKTFTGTVYGHTEIPDGSTVTISVPLRLEQHGPMLYAITRNSVYELGEVAPAYEKAYPLARERILRTWPVTRPADF